jgi:membrane protein YqaA with SNARE-associated domain
VTLLLTTFVVCIASALLPVINAEAYLGGISVLSNHQSLSLVAATAAFGQTVGKTGFFLLGRKSLAWPWFVRRTSSPKWQQRLARWQQRTRDNSWLAAALLALSAVVGLPPLAVLSVLAGQLKVPLSLFVVVCFAGRTLRFASVLGLVAWLT